VFALARLPNGDLAVGGTFTSAGGAPANAIARWDGATWSPFGSGLTGAFAPAVTALGVHGNGDLIAGGTFTFAGGIPVNRCARWTASGWATMGSGLPHLPNRMLTLPNGDVLAGTAGGFQRWNGSAWGGPSGITSGPVRALAYLSDGAIAVGGSFASAGTGTNFTDARNLAYVASNCPATVSISGTGCSGSGGPNALHVVILPWLGWTFRADALGMPGNAFAAAVYGFATIGPIPIASLLPQGGAGCMLGVSPDFLALHLTSGSVLTTQLAIPAAPSLVGAQFHEQVVPFELDAFGSFVLITSTNALTATIGVL
jgi:hypothetical protein